MAKQPTSLLKAAQAAKHLVRFTRPFEEGFASGYVMDIGPIWFVLTLVEDGIRFNGFQCFRQSDVRNLKVPCPNANFIQKALKLHRLRRPRKPRIDLASTETLLLSANRQFPLVTIHRERADPGYCQIGRVVGISKRWLALRKINPDASWDADPIMYQLAQVTRIDFGGGYENALHMVGGDPPGWKPSMAL